MTTLHDIEDRLKRFVYETEGVVGTVLATQEGLTYAFFSKVPVEPDMAAAFVSTIYAYAQKVGEVSRLGPPKEINVHFEKGSVYIFPIGDLILGIRTLPGTRIGLVLVSARKMLKDLKIIAGDALEL